MDKTSNKLKTTTKRVVSVGGGNGQSVTLTALKTLLDYGLDITAVVTTFDSGGSSGTLTREFGFPALGDIRRCLTSIACENGESEATLASIMEYRFPKKSSLQDHPIGNLILAILVERHGSIYGATKELGRMLNTCGNVLPIADEYAELVATLCDGTNITGETKIDTRNVGNPQIEKVSLSRQVEPNPLAIKAFGMADYIVLGPGDLFTSIVPNFLPEGVKETIKKSHAKLIYISNIMTKKGETDDYSVKQFVEQICAYTGRSQIDYLISNESSLDKNTLGCYESEGAKPVSYDQKSLKSLAKNVVLDDFVKGVYESSKIVHDYKKLGFVLKKILKVD